MTVPTAVAGTARRKGAWAALVYLLPALAVFGVFERWPANLPRWIARWGLQVIAVAVAVPFVVAIAYWLTTLGLPEPWYHDKNRLGGYASMTIQGLLIAPWMAVAA